MFIKVKDLELRNLEFDETFAPGAIELLEDQIQTAPVEIGRTRGTDSRKPRRSKCG